MQRLRPYKIRPASDDLPGDENYELSCWELGTQNFEALAGTFNKTLSRTPKQSRQFFLYHKQVLGHVSITSRALGLVLVRKKTIIFCQDVKP